MELLTHEIACAYRDRAKALPHNSVQDAGERRALRQELQERCGITELEAVNILSGFNIGDYCRKYLISLAKAPGTEEAEPGTPRKRQSRQPGSKEIY